MVLNLVCEQLIKVYLGETMVNLASPFLFNQVKKKTLHCDNEKRTKEEFFEFKSPLKETCKKSK